MHVLTYDDVVAIRDDYDRIFLPRARRHSGMCIIWAGLTYTRLVEQGQEAVMLAGSANFPAVEDLSTIPEPYPTHGSYVWEEGEEADRARAGYEACGILAEVHSWVACKTAGGYNFVDLSIKYVPEYFKKSMPFMGTVWTWKPPDYLDAPAKDLLDVDPQEAKPIYSPNRRATLYAFSKYCDACRDFGLKLPKV